MEIYNISQACFLVLLSFFFQDFCSGKEVTFKFLSLADLILEYTIFDSISSQKTLLLCSTVPGLCGSSILGSPSWCSVLSMSFTAQDPIS